ncbi:MAG: PepSY domain-containing protein [Clostridia bacterium]|nr:PepSY domain-containing protein [Clostridia bacterium]
MKKIIAAVLAAVILTFAAAAFAAGNITLEDAKQIALDRAGAAAEDAVFTKAHPDHDDGRPVYDIEFCVGTTEYEMDVDAATGEVTEFETEEHGLLAADGQITEETAKGIALAHAGFKAEEVTFKKVRLDRDDGRAVYEIEFAENGMEHEYDIDAASGRILEYDTDRAD